VCESRVSQLRSLALSRLRGSLRGTLGERSNGPSARASGNGNRAKKTPPAPKEARQ
jgi:hypothetical protein